MSHNHLFLFVPINSVEISINTIVQKFPKAIALKKKTYDQFYGIHFRLELDLPSARTERYPIRNELLKVLPNESDLILLTGEQYDTPKKLIAFDMDSTIVTIEGIDEMACLQGCEKQISTITERAMQGKIDFTESLRQRVGMLKGLPQSKIDEIDIPLSPGAIELVSALNIHTAIISGGFTQFAQRIAQKIKIDTIACNTLEINEGHLTGNVTGEIIDAEGKRNHFIKAYTGLRLNNLQTIAIGDGANDILMLEAAGIAIGYNPKEKLKPHCDGTLTKKPLSLLTLIF